MLTDLWERWVGGRAPNAARVSAALEGKDFPPALAARFSEYLATSGDRELTRIRPFELADAWHADRTTVLRLFLSATRAGLLNLSWDVVHPACKGRTNASGSLEDVAGDSFCPVCDVRFEPQFDRSVEVSFRLPRLSRAAAAANAPVADLSTAATANHVTALQDFRDLFSSEVLALGVELGIESLTVLFTDLIGSTALYTMTGDAPAFRIVHDHFTEMRDVIAMHDGAIVKTIGDAVMAVFVEPPNALSAALALPPAVGMVRTPREPLMLRVGFHSGPCIALRANDKLDYFGTTVNLAARIQHAAGGGEVVMSAATAANAEIAARLGALKTTTEALTFKGFAGEIPVVRVKTEV